MSVRTREEAWREGKGMLLCVSHEGGGRRVQGGLVMGRGAVGVGTGGLVMGRGEGYRGIGDGQRGVQGGLVVGIGWVQGGW